MGKGQWSLYGVVDTLLESIPYYSIEREFLFFIRLGVGITVYNIFNIENCTYNSICRVCIK